MRGLPGRFAASESGAAAVEAAFVLPIMIGLVIFGADGWLHVRHAQNTSTALHAGARYYQEGGADDAAARTLALSAWPGRPQDASVTVARSCACGTTPVSCSTICGSDPPQTFVTLSAQSTFRGLHDESLVRQQEMIRVR